MMRWSPADQGVSERDVDGAGRLRARHRSPQHDLGRLRRHLPGRGVRGGIRRRLHGR